MSKLRETAKNLRAFMLKLHVKHKVETVTLIMHHCVIARLHR